jgi:7-cyano-7-deazaguanine synthase
MARDVPVLTPLMRLTKARSWALAKRLGGEALVEIILEESHTCYVGERKARRDWGYGCGECPACVLRARGFEEWTAAGRPAEAP